MNVGIAPLLLNLSTSWK